MVNSGPNLPVNYTYGRKSHPSDHVTDVIKAQNLQGMADKFNEFKEGKYLSS